MDIVCFKLTLAVTLLFHIFQPSLRDQGLSAPWTMCDETFASRWKGTAHSPAVVQTPNTQCRNSDRIQRHFTYLLIIVKYVRKCSGNNASVCIALSTAGDSESLTTASLQTEQQTHDNLKSAAHGSVQANQDHCQCNSSSGSSSRFSYYFLEHFACFSSSFLVLFCKISHICHTPVSSNYWQYTVPDLSRFVLRVHRLFSRALLHEFLKLTRNVGQCTTWWSPCRT